MQVESGHFRLYLLFEALKFCQSRLACGNPKLSRRVGILFEGTMICSPGELVMKKTDVSRRHFSLLAGTLAAARIPLTAAGPLTAQEGVARIQTNLGAESSANSTDGFKAGDPSTPVKGIATTAMATIDVLKRASAGGANLVITYEPTFFGRQDGPTPPPPPPSSPPPGGSNRPSPRMFIGLAADDPVYTAKKELIEKSGLVVYRMR